MNNYECQRRRRRRRDNQQWQSVIMSLFPMSLIQFVKRGKYDTVRYPSVQAIDPYFLSSQFLGKRKWWVDFIVGVPQLIENTNMAYFSAHQSLNCAKYVNPQRIKMLLQLLTYLSCFPTTSFDLRTERASERLSARRWCPEGRNYNAIAFLCLVIVAY